MHDTDTKLKRSALKETCKKKDYKHGSKHATTYYEMVYKQPQPILNGILFKHGIHSAIAFRMQY